MHPPPSASTSGVEVIDQNVAVVWNLGTGAASVVGDGRVEAVSAAGQVAVNRADGTAAVRAADGTARALPGLTTRDKTHAYAISDDGARVGGVSSGSPVRWSSR